MDDYAGRLSGVTSDTTPATLEWHTTNPNIHQNSPGFPTPASPQFQSTVLAESSDISVILEVSTSHVIIS